MIKGYQKVYEDLLPQLLDCGFKETSERLGLIYSNDETIEIAFLNKIYKITKYGIELNANTPPDYLIFCVLLYYVFSKGSGCPKYSFAPLFRLSGLHEGNSTNTKSLTNSELTRTFGSDYENFKSSAIKLGGKVSNTPNHVCYSWIFTLFPKIITKIDFYEADDEFPAEIQMFFDEVTTQFLDFECIAFLAGCLVKELTKSAEKQAIQSDFNNLSHCGFIQKML